MTEPSKIADRILAVFRELPDRPILGSNLGLQVKTHFPDFNPLVYGCQNLRRFLQAYVPEIVETRRSGQDVEYSLKAAVPPVAESGSVRFAGAPPPVVDAKLASSMSPIRHDLWKTFVSPNGAYQMYVDPADNIFRILRRGEPALPAPWINVPPCPAEVHLNIAREFSQQVSDPQHRNELESVLGAGFWWDEFLRIARLKGLDKDWIRFRRTRLSQEFERVLSAIGVPVSAAAGAWPSSSTLRPARRSAGTASLPDEQLRSALQRVVGRLSSDELRRIWLPVGIVLDEVQSN